MPGADITAISHQTDPLAVVEQQRRDARVRQPSRLAEGIDDGQQVIGRKHGTKDAGNLPHMSRVTSRSSLTDLAGIFPHMPRDIRERIQERLDETGKSKRAASLDGGLGADAIRDLMRRPDDSPTLETVSKLADGLQTSAAWLAFEAGPKTLSASRREASLVSANKAFTLAKVDGPVAAGMFLARPAFDDDLGEVISAPRDPEYPFARQIAYRVEGDSMDKAQPRPIRHGDFIICAAWEDLDLPEKDGLLVVVQQTLAQEQLRERSVKVLKLYNDRREFVPMSSNPEHKSIVVPRDADPNDGREVKIIALVRYVFDNQPIR